MSPQMPEFEMPPVGQEPARPAARSALASSAPRPAHTADPDAPDVASQAGRNRINWRHVMVATVLGVVAGAVLPGGIQLAERAAVSGDQSDLRAVATAYLTAIADGRASDATAMVPLPAADNQMPDAVLQSAARITDPAVRLVHIDGDAATVDVEYTLGRPQITRSLDAERVDGTWQITSPLFEGVTFYQYTAVTGAQIAGFEIDMDAPVQLYPGIYTFDPQLDDPIIVMRSDPFSVDGDPVTPTEPFAEVTLQPELAERARAIALAVGEQCMDADSCPFPVGSELEVEQQLWVMGASEQSVDLGVQLSARSQSTIESVQVVIQIQRDAAGAGGAWLCGQLNGYQAFDLEPCPTIG